MKHRHDDSLHIVLIQNEEALAELYKLALESRDIEVLVANDGSAGLELISRVLPDAIVLDLGLPDFASGLSFLVRLKSLAATRRIPVGILSIDDTNSMKRLCLYLGAVDYLVKTSISPAMLAELVPAWVTRS